MIDVTSSTDLHPVPGAVKDGTTSANAAFAKAINLATATGDKILVPAGDYSLTSSIVAKSNVEIHLEAGAYLRRDFNGSSTDMSGNIVATNPGTLIRNESATTPITNFKITGFGGLGNVIRPSSGTPPVTGINRYGRAIYIFGNDCSFSNFTVDGYEVGQALLICGDRWQIDNLRIFKRGGTTPEEGTGGIRMAGGKDFVCMNCHVECGDDASQFVPFPPNTGSGEKDIFRGKYIGCTGVTTKGRFFAVGQVDPNDPGLTMTNTIEDVSFITCHGKAKGRAVVVFNEASEGKIVVERPERIAIRNVSFVDCSVEMLAPALDEQVRGLQEAYISRDKATLSPPSGLVSGIRFHNFRIVSARRCVLKTNGPVDDLLFEGCDFIGTSNVPPDPFPGGAAVENTIIELSSATNVVFRDCTFTGSGTETTKAADLIRIGAGGLTCQNVLVDGCSFTDITNSATVVRYAINSRDCARLVIINACFAQASGSNAGGVSLNSVTILPIITRSDFSRISTTSRKILDGAVNSVKTNNRM